LPYHDLPEFFLVKRVVRLKSIEIDKDMVHHQHKFRSRNLQWGTAARQLEPTATYRLGIL
jgi:hypothetical protein